jgi:hypothetical protein
MGWMTIPHILNFPWNIYQHLPTFTNISLQNHPGLWLNLPWSMGSLQAAPKPPAAPKATARKPAVPKAVPEKKARMGDVNAIDEKIWKFLWENHRSVGS